MKFTFFLILFPLLSFSQQYDNRYFNKALELYEQKDIVRATKYLYMILKDDRSNPQANILLAQIYEEKNQINKSLDHYDIAIDEMKYHNSNFNKDSFNKLIYRVSNLNFDNGRYKQAKIYMDKIVGHNKEFTERIDFAIKLKDNPVNFKPINLGKNINSDITALLPKDLRKFL